MTTKFFNNIDLNGTLTIAGSGGTSGYFLSTNGSGVITWAAATGLPTTGGTMTGALVIAATTSSINGLKLTANSSGPLLAAGAIDFDGNAFFATPKVNNTTAGRGLIPTQQYFIPSSPTTIATTSTGLTTITGAAMGNKFIYLAASTTYEVEAVLYVQTSWSVTSASNFSINLSYPTGSTAVINGFYSYTAAITTASTAITQLVLNSTGAVIISASPTSGNYARVELKGIIKTSTTAGNFSPIFGITNASTPATATITIAANSFIKVNPIGGVSADINIGGWA